MRVPAGRASNGIVMGANHHVDRGLDLDVDVDEGVRVGLHPERVERAAPDDERRDAHRRRADDDRRRTQDEERSDSDDLLHEVPPWSVRNLRANAGIGNEQGGAITTRRPP